MSMFSSNKIINKKSSFKKKDIDKITMNHPNMIPVVIKDASSDLDFSKSKFLVPNDLTMGQFFYVLRKNTKITHNEGVFIMINNIMVQPNKLIKEYYHTVNNNKGLLMITVCKENTFG